MHILKQSQRHKNKMAQKQVSQGTMYFSLEK
jgi:hypothetical protein